MSVSDLDFARDLARRTGDLLVPLRASVGYDDRRQLALTGDRAAQDFIAQELATHRPGDAILSEEAPDDLARLDADRVWIIDPIDGTSSFSSAGRSEWAIHIALWQRGTSGERGELVLGVVGMPATGELFDSATATLAPRPPGRLRVVGSRSRFTPLLQEVAAGLGAEVHHVSSAGVKVITVVKGDNDIYLHSGGQYQWDNAAPVAVARAAGLFTSRIDGSPIVYNARSTAINDLIVCRPEYADDVLAAVRRHL